MKMLAPARYMRLTVEKRAGCDPFDTQDPSPKVRDTYGMLEQIQLGSNGVNLRDDENDVEETGDEEEVVDRQQLTMQPGPQTVAASTTADITFFGGQAGGGKSHWLLLNPVRGTTLKGFTCVTFRRNFAQIKKAGGLWDASMNLYPLLGATPREGDASWRFPNGCRIQFGHLEHESDKMSWAGAELAHINFDEVTHFTATQFWFLLSRNRSTCGYRPCVNATCNPEPESWVFKLIAWWIGDDGLPIDSRSGVIRWFIRDGESDTMIWADSPEQFGEKQHLAKSFTFIRSKLSDNPALTEKDPGYAVNLASLPKYERELLLGGNWKVRRASGMRFQRHWFQVINVLSARVVRRVRYWDRASTEVSARNQNPDRTAGVRVALLESGMLVVEDVCVLMGRPAAVRAAIRNCAGQDAQAPGGCELWLEEDPGQAGVAEKMDLARDLAEFAPRFKRPTGSKWQRSASASAQAEVGNIQLLAGPWIEEYLSELEAFCDPDTLEQGEAEPHDDRVDGTSGAVNELINTGSPRIHS